VRAMAPHNELWQHHEYRALFEPDEPSPPAQPPIAAVR
jgi:hypothetical protein